MWVQYQMSSTTILMAYNLRRGRSFTSGMTSVRKRSLLGRRTFLQEALRHEHFKKLLSEFRQDGKGLCTVNPFKHCITIASLCNAIFRIMLLEKETISFIAHEGCRMTAKPSAVAYRWMSYVAHSHGIFIQHGRNVGNVLDGCPGRRHTQRL